MKVVGIHQPNYLPWIGYFYKMQHSDIFVFADNVQFGMEGSLTQRTTIKTAGGPLLMTVPVLKKGIPETIKDKRIYNESGWQNNHVRTVMFAYSKAPFFKLHFPALESALRKRHEFISNFNMELIITIAGILGIVVPMVKASDLNIDTADKNGRIIEICKAVNGDAHLSGEGGRKYNDLDAYKENHIELLYTGFSPPVYPQIYGDFIPGLSVLDALFNIGAEGVMEIIGA